jgi:hypothetical protein
MMDNATNGTMAEPGTARTPYTFAVMRVVPKVHTGAYVAVGIVLFAPTADFLGMRVMTDVSWLSVHTTCTDSELLSRYLQSCHAVCHGDAAAGPLAMLAPSERFHWLTAHRSDVIQSGPVHEGVGEDPREALEELFGELVVGE